MSTPGRRRKEDRDPYAESVAAVVRAEAARAGLRGNEVAKIMNLSPSTVSTKMRGIHNFSVSDIARFARYLGLTPGELMDNIDVPMSVRNERLLRLAEAAQAQQEEEGASSTSRQEEERSDEDGGASSRPYRPAPGSGGVEAPYSPDGGSAVRDFFSVVPTGVDPVTFRFSVERSTN